MNAENLLLKEWRKLPVEKQQQAIDFVVFLGLQIKDFPERNSPSEEPTKAIEMPENKLGDRLLEIRQRIVDSGVHLLGPEEIEKEIAERRLTTNLIKTLISV